MGKIIKRKDGITMVSLVVTIIILIILAGVSINLTLGENGIIRIAKRAKENIELSQIEEQTKLNELYTKIEIEGGTTGEISYDSIAKLNNFKKAIADYIEVAGGIKPEYTADTETFGESIKGIVKEVTKDATATADNITEGKTAWVNGELITGTGKDNNDYYKKGSEESSGIVWVKLGSITRGDSSTKKATFDCTNIPNYESLTNNNFTFKNSTSYVAWKTDGSGGTATTGTIVNPTMSYNSTTGILTVTCTGTNFERSTRDYSEVYPGYTIYCIY